MRNQVSCIQLILFPSSPRPGYVHTRIESLLRTIIEILESIRRQQCIVFIRMGLEWLALFFYLSTSRLVVRLESFPDWV